MRIPYASMVSEMYVLELPWGAMSTTFIIIQYSSTNIHAHTHTQVDEKNAFHVTDACMYGCLYVLMLLLILTLTMSMSIVHPMYSWCSITLFFRNVKMPFILYAIQKYYTPGRSLFFFDVARQPRFFFKSAQQNAAGCKNLHQRSGAPVQRITQRQNIDREYGGLWALALGSLSVLSVFVPQKNYTDDVSSFLAPILCRPGIHYRSRCFSWRANFFSFFSIRSRRQYVRFHLPPPPLPSPSSFCC
jgi:hypothetical protein